VRSIAVRVLRTSSGPRSAAAWFAGGAAAARAPPAFLFAFSCKGHGLW